MTTKISKIAEKHLLHTCDTNHDTGEKVAFFTGNGYDETSWGVWIDRHGNVDVDSTSSNGEMPPSSLLPTLKTAARKLLAE